MHAHYFCFCSGTASVLQKINQVDFGIIKQQVGFLMSQIESIF